MNEELLQLYGLLKQSAPKFIGGMTEGEFLQNTADRSKFVHMMDVLEQHYSHVLGSMTKQQVIDKVYPVRPQPDIFNEKPNYGPLKSGYVQAPDQPQTQNPLDYGSVFDKLEEDVKANKPKAIQQAFPAPVSPFPQNVNEDGLTPYQVAALENEGINKKITPELRKQAITTSIDDLGIATPEEWYQYVYSGEFEEATKRANILEKNLQSKLDSTGKIDISTIPTNKNKMFMDVAPIQSQAYKAVKDIFTADPLKTPKDIINAKSLPGYSMEELNDMKQYLTAHQRERMRLEENVTATFVDLLERRAQTQIPASYQVAVETINRANTIAEQQGDIPEEMVPEVQAAMKVIEELPEDQKRQIKSIQNGYEAAQFKSEQIKNKFPDAVIANQLESDLSQDFSNKYVERGWALNSLMNIAGAGVEFLPRLSEGMQSTFETVVGALGSDAAAASMYRRSMANRPLGTFRDASVAQRPISERTATFFHDFGDGEPPVKYEVGFNEQGEPTNIYDQNGNAVRLEEKMAASILKDAAKHLPDAKFRFNRSAAWNAVSDGLSDFMGTAALASITGGAGMSLRGTEALAIAGQYMGRFTEEGLAMGLSLEEASVRAGMKTGVEAFTESINPIAASLTNAAQRATLRQYLSRALTDPSQIRKLGTRTFLTDFTKQIVSEGGEEILANEMSPYVDRVMNAVAHTDIEINDPSYREDAEAFSLGAAITIIPALISGTKNRNRVMSERFGQESAYQMILNLDRVQDLAPKLNNAKLNDMLPVFMSTKRETEEYMDDARLSEDLKIQLVAATLDKEKATSDLQKTGDTIYQAEAKYALKTAEKTLAEVKGKVADAIVQNKLDLAEDVSGFRGRMPDAEPAKNERVFSDFDDTLFNPRTNRLTPLGEEMRKRIADGENVNIITSREDTQENRRVISEALGISPDKVTMGIAARDKAAKIAPNSTFYGNDPDEIDGARTVPGVEVVDVNISRAVSSSIEKAGTVQNVPERVSPNDTPSGINTPETTQTIPDQVQTAAVETTPTTAESAVLNPSGEVTTPPVTTEQVVQEESVEVQASKKIDEKIAQLEADKAKTLARKSDDELGQIKDLSTGKTVLEVLSAPFDAKIEELKKRKEALTPQEETKAENISLQTAENTKQQATILTADTLSDDPEQLNQQIKQVNDGTALLERFSQAEQSGLREGGEHHVAATIITGRGNIAGEEQDERADRQESAVEKYARRVKIWFANPVAKLKKLYGKPFAKGNESDVFYDPKRGVVIKASTIDQYRDLQDALDGITAHNAAFPASKQTVIGFGTDSEGNFQIITEQPFIKEGRRKSTENKATQEEIDALMKGLGFEVDDSLGIPGRYKRDDLLARDITPKNVIRTPGGHIIPIDTIMHLNTEVWGGSRPEAVLTAEEVTPQVEEVAQETVPVEQTGTFTPAEVAETPVAQLDEAGIPEELPTAPTPVVETVETPIGPRNVVDSSEPPQVVRPKALEDIQVLKGTDIKVPKSGETLNLLGIPTLKEDFTMENEEDSLKLRLDVVNTAVTGEKYANTAKEIYGEDPIQWVPALLQYAETAGPLKENIILTYLVYHLSTVARSTVEAGLLREVQRRWKIAGSQASEVFNSRRALRALVNARKASLLRDTEVTASYEDRAKEVEKLLEATRDDTLHEFESVPNEYVAPETQKQRKGKERKTAKKEAEELGKHKDALVEKIKEKQNKLDCNKK